MSVSNRIRYVLIRPSNDNHAFNAISDITEVMHRVSEHYVSESTRKEFDNEINGFPQRVNRAIKKKSEVDLMQVINEYNTTLARLVDQGVVSSILDEKKWLHPGLVERILNQTYSRTVSPNLKLLSKYEAGTDNVYGELLPRFISSILKKDTGMKSDQLFVDLGSGVGNVVLQAALEIGCESWGCEMMEEYSVVAKNQHREFEARCRLWGLAIGDIHLEQGDFLVNHAIKDVLKRADVVLVNNQVFTPELNEHLTTLFLDLKDGCRIVSLKSFVPAAHRITDRNSENPYNLLDVEEKRYYSNCVSWTSQSGTYFVSTKDSKRVENFFKRAKVST